MIGRYDVFAELGRSCMGVVYAATDRLTGQRVALRRVTAPLVESAEAPDAGDRRAGGRLRLSWQLRLIASLRHPNLATVIDYGFDHELQPFYTHRLIEQPVELLEAGRDQPLAKRLDLLSQVLQGLTYLHRRGAVHGDLRPQTALVDGDEVRLVNFGVSASRQTESGASADYLAPEVRRGGPATVAADLYAVGVLACAMLTKRPASSRGSAQAVDVLPGASPVISTRDYPAPLIPVLLRLLAPDPAERYSDPADVIRDLAAALLQPFPEESAAVRESFLETARFVGREEEMERLSSLLQRVLAGHGAGLIVAGESGVGKSRLVDELRLLALAQCALVFQGRSASEGFNPYHSWRQILLHLCLMVEVGAAEAAVLERQIPGLGEFLDRRVGEPWVLDPMAAKQRFVDVVEGLFSRLEQPAVVILEDLHWAGSESLSLLLELHRRASRRPLLWIGTYRDDERPDLSTELAEVPAMELPRLGRDAIAHIAESMLGSAGRRSQLVDFLHRETQGNLFFLVEIVRVLGEEAGRLDRIDPQRLPGQVTTGGIERILRRRLDRLPKRVRPLLRLAAVAGREVDLRLLEALEPGLQSRLWLRFCADQALLESVGGNWRFASDRYREALLDELSAAELRAAHRRVAEAIAATYGDGAEHGPALAYHWARAADLNDPEAADLAITHLARTGAAALASCANREAEELFRRGLELLDNLPAGRDQQECRLQLGLGGTYLMSRGYTVPEVGQAFGRARRLGERLGTTTELMPALVGLWRFHVTRAELRTARQLAEEMLRFAEAGRRASHRMLAEYTLGATILFQGEPEPGSRHLQRAIDLFATLRSGSRGEIAAAAFYLGQNPGVAALAHGGWATWLLGYPEHAQALSRRARELAVELDHPFSLAFARMLQSWLDQMRDDPRATAASARAAADLCREQGYPNVLAVSSIFLGWARTRLGEAEAGIEQILSALDDLRAAGLELFRPSYLALLGEAHGAASRPRQGIALVQQAIETAVRRGSGHWLAELHRLLGEQYLLLPQPNREAAARSFRRAIDQARLRRERSLELRALVSLVRLYRGDAARRWRTLSELDGVYRSFSEGFETPDLLAARALLSSE